MARIRPSKGLDDFIPSGSLLTGAADAYPAASDRQDERHGAFRGENNAAISESGIVLAGGADAYPAPPATPRRTSKLTTFFPRFLADSGHRNAPCGSPHFVQHKMIFRDNGERAKLVCDLAFPHP